MCRLYLAVGQDGLAARQLIQFLLRDLVVWNGYSTDSNLRTLLNGKAIPIAQRVATMIFRSL